MAISASKETSTEMVNSQWNIFDWCGIKDKESELEIELNEREKEKERMWERG